MGTALKALVVVLLLCACGAKQGPGPELSSFSPERVSMKQRTDVVATGNNLLPRVRANFDRPSRSEVDAAFRLTLETPEPVELENVRWVSQTELAARVPAGLPAGIFSVTLTAPDGRTARLENALEVVRARLSDGGVLDSGYLDGGILPDGGCLSWQDFDGDGWGNPMTADAVCLGPGRAPQGADCRDRDALTNPDRDELCNLLDDNCDGFVDEEACSPDAGWAPVVAPRGTGVDWWTVAVAPGLVWLAGNGGEVALKGSDGTFADVSTSCGSGWLASAVDPLEGTLFLGGINGSSNGFAGRHRPDAGSCFAVDQRNVNIRGVAAVRDAQGLLVHGVTGQGTLLDYRADGTYADRPGVSNAQANEIGGVSRDGLFIGGQSNANNRPVVFRLGPDAGWNAESLAALNLPVGALRGISMLDAERGFAVGDNAVLLVRSADAGWSRVPGFDAGSPDFWSVKAFGPGRVYVVDDTGGIWRTDGASWEQVYRHPTGLFRDLGGVAEDDLWAVGDNGVVVHFQK